MDWSEFWIEHGGDRRGAETFGLTFLPELLRVVEQHAGSARTFLEWGTGVSTLLLARIAAARDGQVVTVDHDAGYARSVMSRLPPSSPVRSLVADLVGPKLSQADAGLSYSSTPLALAQHFDFVLIDGRRRMECTQTAFLLASPSTVAALHDYRRGRYQAVSVLFETIEAGDQFRVMRPRPELLRLTEATRADVLRSLRGTATA